jgi:cytoskeletal protein CcmA (bactofilin family)
MLKKISAAVTIALMLPTLAFAATFQSEDRLFISVPLSDDIYIVGGQVKIDSNVSGDVIIAAGEIDINGNISEDILAVGGQILINGNVQDDVRIAGGEVTVQGEIGDDFIIAGGIVNILADSNIGGDLIITGGEVQIDGTVAGNLKANGGRIILNGTINQTVQISGSIIEINGVINETSQLAAEEILLGPDVDFKGSIEYWTPYGEIDFGEANATFSEELGNKFNRWSDNNNRFETSIKLITGLSALLITFLLLFFRKFFTKAAKKYKDNFWQSLSMGIGYLILAPLAGIILIATVIGIPLGLLLIAIYSFSLLFAVPMTSVILAAVLEKKNKGKWSKLKFFGVCIIALMSLKIVTIIPIIGWLIGTIAISTTFGSILTLNKK